MTREWIMPTTTTQAKISPNREPTTLLATRSPMALTPPPGYGSLFAHADRPFCGRSSDLAQLARLRPGTCCHRNQSIALVARPGTVSEGGVLDGISGV